MKFRVLLSITLAITAINGAFIVYRMLRPASPDQKPIEKTVPPVAQPSIPALPPEPPPEKKPAPEEKHAMLTPPPAPRLSGTLADRVVVESGTTTNAVS